MVFPNSGAQIPRAARTPPAISLVTSLAGLDDLHHLEERAVRLFCDPDTITKILKALVL